MFKLLLIDDEVYEGESALLDKLRKEGIKVTTVNSASDALDVVRATQNFTFDCVLLDIMLPPDGSIDFENTNGGLMAGRRIAEEIRKYYPALPIVVLSAHSRERLERELAPGMCDTILEKPTSPVAIISALQRTLGVK